MTTPALRSAVSLAVACVTGLTVAAAQPGRLVLQAGDQFGTEGFGCTFAFPVEDEFGRDYVGTAGHCVDRSTAVEVSEGIWVFGDDGPEAWHAIDVRHSNGLTGHHEQGPTIGRFVLAANDNGSRLKDFALIKLERNVVIEPVVKGWDMPIQYFREPDLFDRILHHGGGHTIEYVMPSRETYVSGIDETAISYPGLTMSGDSGSPVISEEGHALGIHVHIGGADLDRYGHATAVRIDHSLAFASAALGLDLRLVTAR